MSGQTFPFSPCRQSGPHHDGGPEHANGGTDPVSRIGGFSVDSPAPEYRKNDEDRSIGGVDSSERVLLRLEDGNQSVSRKEDQSKQSEKKRTPLAKPQPNEVAASYLKNTSKDEKENRAHAPKLAVAKRTGKECVHSRIVLGSGFCLFPRGTGGRSPSDDFPGAWYQAPCWLGTLTHQIEFTENKANQRITMEQNETQSYSTNATKTLNVSLLSALIAITLLTTACGTTSHRRKMMNDVLSQQNELLRQIEFQRREPNVLRKVRRDETLWRAEATLREAIRSLRESNEAIKSTL